MFPQHALNEGAVEACRGEGATVRGERDQPIRVDRFESHIQPTQPTRGGFDHARQKERGVPVCQDDARVSGERGEQFATVAPRGFDVGVVGRPAFRRAAAVHGHDVQNEHMKPVVRAGVVRAQGLEDDERHFQSDRVVDRALQPKVPSQAPG